MWILVSRFVCYIIDATGGIAFNALDSIGVTTGGLKLEQDPSKFFPTTSCNFSQLLPLSMLEVRELYAIVR
jgi:hypothetical protein